MKQIIEAMDECESRVAAWENACRAMLDVLDRAAEQLARDLENPFRAHIQELRRSLDPRAAPPTIAKSTESIGGEFAGFVGQVVEVWERKEKEYKQVFRMVVEALAILSGRASSKCGELKEFAAKMESDSRLESIIEIRQALAGRASELKDMADRMEEQDRAEANALERRLLSAEERIRVAEMLAETDPLTGVGNRRMAENAMKSAIASGVCFSLILFDLNNFKLVNDRYGQLQGDRLLKAVAVQIQRFVRDTDVVCRWGGDEFTVLLPNTSLVAAEERAVPILQKAFGHFVLENGAGVEIGASVGISEYQPGETADEFFDRADATLYGTKVQKRAAAQMQR